MPSAQPPTVTLTRHPPERGRGAPDVAPAGCCCCCLHSVGGIIGGILGSLVFMESGPQQMPEGSPFPFRRDVFEEENHLFPTVVLIYWAVVACLSALLVLGPYLSGEPFPVAIQSGTVLVLLFLPAVQMAASVLLMPVVLLIPWLRPSRDRLAVVALHSLVGCFLGLMAMLFLIATLNFTLAR